MKRFPKIIHPFLAYYLYAYVNPTDRKIFYIGMGQKDRIFNIDRDSSQYKVYEKIEEILKAGHAPELHLLRWGLKKWLSPVEVAKVVEETLIDTIGIENLTNTIRSTESKFFGRMSPRALVASLSSNNSEITHPSIMFWANVNFNYSLSPQELYDSTRQNWDIGEMRNKAEIAFCIIDGIIWEVYQIEKWVQRKDSNWDFEGRIADVEIRTKYLNLAVRRDYSPHVSIPTKSFRYLNIKRGKTHA